MLKLYSFLICLLVLSVVIEGDESDTATGLTIKLNRQKTAYEQHLNNAPLLEKYGINLNWFYKKHKPKPGPPRTNDSIALYRFLDNEFYGTIVIGHPGQILNVAFDTAWSYSWVLSSKCQPFLHIGCFFHNKYDHTKSSEWKPDNRPITIPEGKYNLSGFFSYDNVSISHSNVTNFSFIEMTSVPYTFLFNKIDGVLGLGLQGTTYEPFLYTLIRQKKIKEPIFCIYLNRDKQSQHGGNVILGFLEKRHIHNHKDENNNTVYDPIKYMPVKSGNYWEFDVDAVYIAEYEKEQALSFCKGKSCSAITDTSSNNIIGPKEYVDKIHSQIKANYFYFDRYLVNCDSINKLPEIALTIGGKNFTLQGRDYTVKMSYFSITLCLSAFVAHDYHDFWVLGGAFLSQYYTIYNIQDKQIGIVQAA